MKKKYIIVGILIGLVIIAIASFIIYNIIIENGKKYEIEKIEKYNYFVLRQNDMYGVIDTKANQLILPEYNEVVIPNPEKGVFICYQGEDTKILNEKNEEILTQYIKVEPIRLENMASDLMYEKSVLKYMQDGKYGLINFEGKQITKPIYDEIASLPYKEGELLVKQNEKYGVINIKGNKLIEIKYDEIAIDEYYTDENQYQFAGYIVSIKTDQGYRYGYLNNKGKEILKTEYNQISRVTEIQDNENSYLIFAQNGQYGVNKNDKSIISNEYQSIRYDATNHVFVVEKSKKYGIINLEGKLIVPVEYNQIDITGIYFYAENEQGTTVYNNNGTQANINPNVSILNTNNEKYKIRINNENGTKYGLINQDGKQLIEEKYNYMEYLYDNYFMISGEDGKLGIVDNKGNIQIDAIYDSLQKIPNTYLIQTTLSQNKITQIYTRTMEKICEMKDATIEVKDNVIKISNESEEKYIDLEGKELKNTQVYPSHSLFVAVEGNKYGFVDYNGNIKVNYQYDKAYEFNEYGFAAVKKDGKWGCINEQGQEVISPTYEIKDQKEPSFIGSYYKVTYGYGEFYYTDSK